MTNDNERERETVNVFDRVAGEDVDVPGHWANRDPDMTETEARQAALRGELRDTDIPVLLSSEMRTDPTEGTHGTYRAVGYADCPHCGSDHCIRSVHTLAGVGFAECLLCGETLSEW